MYCIYHLVIAAECYVVVPYSKRDEAPQFLVSMPPLADHPSLHLQVLPQTFEVKQYSCSNDIPAEALDQLKITLSRSGLFSLTRTDEEVSVVGEAHTGEGRWRCIKIMGPMDFGYCFCVFLAAPDYIHRTQD